MSIIKAGAERYAKIIQAVAFDVDGVVTDNCVWDGFPYKVKQRNYYDSQGVSLLRAIGLKIAFVTSDKDAAAIPIQQAVTRWNTLPSSWGPENPEGWPEVALFTGTRGQGKVTVIDSWLCGYGIPWEKCAAMGDDLVDIPLLKKAAFPVAPAQAEAVVKKMALFISKREGGHGAIRDFVNFILETRGIDPTTLPLQ